jgi:peptidoglycan-N-acetylglucosamine deacetylase
MPPKKTPVKTKHKPLSKIHVITTAMRPAGDVDEKSKYVALTFDDGPNPQYTPQVLAILKREGIHATFCLIGRHVKEYPDLVRQIVADGHKIANHSMNHDLCLKDRTAEKIESEILDTKTLLEATVPGTKVEYFRAPGGNFDRHMRELVVSWGMQSLGWSVDTKDWQRPGVDQILDTVKAQLHPGGVILMHDAGGDRTQTIEALEKLIPQLREQGYQFAFPG